MFNAFESELKFRLKSKKNFFKALPTKIQKIHFEIKIIECFYDIINGNKSLELTQAQMIKEKTQNGPNSKLQG